MGVKQIIERALEQGKGILRPSRQHGPHQLDDAASRQQRRIVASRADVGVGVKKTAALGRHPLHLRDIRRGVHAAEQFGRNRARRHRVHARQQADRCQRPHHPLEPHAVLWMTRQGVLQIKRIVAVSGRQIRVPG